MIEAEQFSLDFEDPVAALELQLREQYEKNRRDQDAYWGPDRYVIHWVYGCHAREEWNGLPEYERHKWRSWHQGEQERVEHGGKMRSAAHLHALNEEAFQREEEMAARWAVDLRDAFLKGQPCPIRATPGLLGTEHILRRAFDLAHVNPASIHEAQPEAEEA